ncbi:MAG: S-layer homology domain-containing protein, partial [Oscillospiraceae bacterium]|nr:S-layer homology domain-containing protein [Oscillospiraceae bacterium]
TEIATGELTATLEPEYSYYYIRVTQADGDLAVTAPVWVGESISVGIDTVESETEQPVLQKPVKLTTTLFNNEDAAVTVKSLTYTTDGSKVLGADTKGYTIPANGTVPVSFEFTPDVAKRMTITVTAVIQVNGADLTYTKDITLSVRESEGALPVTDIAKVQAQTEKGFEYAIEGVVTSNASGYDKDTAFFDCVYVQDATAGICCFPVSGNYKIGDKVHVEGYTDFYQGEAELQVTAIEVLSENNPVTPTETTAAKVNDGSVLGSLITLKGTLESYELVNGLIQTILVKDQAGDVARVFIDGYITTDKEVENFAEGCTVTVTGLASYDDTFNAPEGPFPRIRIRDRADVVIGHSLTAVAEIPATCEEPGVKAHWKCEVCGKLFSDAEGKTALSEPETIAALGHDWDEGQIAKAPTFTAEGEMTYTCKHDPSHTKTEPIAKQTHCDGGDDCPSIQFTDVDRSADSWYHEPVDWAFVEGITTGKTTSLFAPNDDCTREQVVTFLWRAAGSPEPTTTDCPFTDVKADAYSYQAILWAVENKITNGTAADKFSPADTCTREQIVTFLYRFEKEPAITGAENPFTDVKEGYSYNAILWAAESGVTTGRTATTFAPKDTCTRAEVVTFLYRDLA